MHYFTEWICFICKSQTVQTCNLNMHIWVKTGFVKYSLFENELWLFCWSFLNFLHCASFRQSTGTLVCFKKKTFPSFYEVALFWCLRFFFSLFFWRSVKQRKNKSIHLDEARIQTERDPSTATTRCYNLHVNEERSSNLKQVLHRLYSIRVLMLLLGLEERLFYERLPLESFQSCKKLQSIIGNSIYCRSLVKPCKYGWSSAYIFLLVFNLLVAGICFLEESNKTIFFTNAILLFFK